MTMIGQGIGETVRTVTISSVLLLGIAGCAPHEDTYYRNTRAIENASVTVRDLTGPAAMPSVGAVADFTGTDGWTRTPGPPNEIRFFKYLDKPALHTAVIRAYPIFPPRQFSDAQDFTQAISADLQKTRDKNGNDLVFEVSRTSEWGPGCVSFHRKTKNLSGVGFVYEGFELICVHPTQRTRFANIGYSERYKEGDNAGDVEARAKEMLRRITFTGADT